MSILQHFNHRVFLALVFSIILAGGLQAEIRPSFHLESSIWNATDIVIADEGETIDGNLKVREVYAGSLNIGDKISIPELAQFAAKESRTVGSIFNRSKDPKIISGDKLVLFLRRDLLHKGANIKWKPATRFGGINVSVLWIEKDELFGFTQIINPGPAMLTDQKLSGEQLVEKIEVILEARKALRLAREMKDTKLKAKAAAAHLNSPIYSVSIEAFSLISECGPDALPHLRKILKADEKPHMRDKALKAFGTAGGMAVVPELTKMVESELSFWKKTAPGLKQGWWNNMRDKRTKELRERYVFLVLEIFYALKRLESPACKTAVTEFRDFWRSLPQLEDSSGLTQMSKACDAVLSALPNN